MKQYITKEQLNELNGMQKKKLGEFVTGNDNFFLNNYPNQPNLLLLSIGQMIEFIEDSKPEWRGITLHHTPGGDMSFPEWMITQNYGVNKITSQYLFKEELCDALWEVVKEVLNEN